MAAVTHEREVKNVVMFSGEYGRLKIIDVAMIGRIIFSVQELKWKSFPHVMHSLSLSSAYERISLLFNHFRCADIIIPVIIEGKAVAPVKQHIRSVAISIGYFKNPAHRTA